MMYELTFFSCAQCKHNKNIQGHSKHAVHARSHVVVDQSSFQGRHERIVDAATDFEQAKTPKRNALTRNENRYAQA
jgi:hypothetical protein